MAAVKGYVPLVVILAVLFAISVQGQEFRCRRLRGIPTPLCRFVCSYYDGYAWRSVLLKEKDGTPCGWSAYGICWSGQCFPLLSQQNAFSQQSHQSSQRPLRIRKRDTGSVLAAGANGAGSEASMEFTKSVTKSVGSSGSGGGMHKGVKTATVKRVNVGGSTKTSRKIATSEIEVDPFSNMGNIRSTTSQSDNVFATAGGEQQGHQGVGGTAVNVNRGGSSGSSFSSLDITKSITTSEGGLAGGTNTGGSVSGGGTQGQTNTPSRTGGASTIEGERTVNTRFGGATGGRRNFPSPGVGTSAQVGGVAGNIFQSLSPGLTTTTTNVGSTTTLGYDPSLTIPRATKQGALTGGVTGGGVEVEVPGYTTGVGRNWKWVLGRKVGFLPPNVQALDPEILYYKLGYQQPQLPSLPESVQTLLNRVPVRPVGSDLIGYPGTTTILDSIHKLGGGLGGPPSLRSLLLKSRLSHPNTHVSLLRALLTGDSPSPLSPLDRIFLSNVSPLGRRLSGLWPSLFSSQRGSPYGSPFSGLYNGYLGGIFGSLYDSPFNGPYSSPYGGPYGVPYSGIYGSPWSGFPGSTFPGSPWTFYSGGPMGPFGSSAPSSPFYTGLPFGAYPFPRSPFYSGYPGFGGTVPTPGLTSSSTVSTTSGLHYTLSPDGKLVPAAQPSSPLSVTSVGGQPSYSKSTTVHSVTSTSPTGVRYVQSPDGTLVPVNDVPGGLAVQGTTYPGNNQAAQVSPEFIRSVTRTRSLQRYPRGYTLTRDGQLIPASDSLLPGVGPLSALSRDPNSPFYRLLRGPYGEDTRATSYLRSVLTGGQSTSPYHFLHRLSARPSSASFDSVLRKTLLGEEPGEPFGLSGDDISPFGPGVDGIIGLAALLSDGTVDPNGPTAKYLAALAGIDPALLRSLGPSSLGPVSSRARTIELLRRLRLPYGSTDSIAQLLYGRRQPLDRRGLRYPFDISGRSDTLDAILGLSGKRPESEGTTSWRKEFTKALLTARQPQTSPTGKKQTVISEVVTAAGPTPSQTAPRTGPGSQVVSSTYHATNVQATSPVTSSPVVPGIQISEQRGQPVVSPAVLGVKSVSSVTSGTLPTYGTSGISPLYPMTTSGVFINGHFVPSAGGVLGSAIGHLGVPSLPSGGYPSYSVVPTTNALLSATSSTHPYVLATSAVGGHPHYVVEGHEAPGTRWQLKVWRHHPGVSALIPGLTGVGTSPLSGMLSQAAQSLTQALPLTPQPSHFGFTSYHSSTPGLGLLGTSPLGGIPTLGVSGSNYIVHAPDGSVVVSRQPGTLGAATLVSPLSFTQTPGVLIPGGTHITRGTVAVPATTGSVLTDPFQATVVGGTPAGGVTTTRYQQYSAVQGGGSGLSSGIGSGQTSLLDSVGYGGESENMGSSFSRGSSGSDSILSNALYSQSKLKK